MATVRPAGIAAAAILWRRDGNAPWERIARVPFDDKGRAAWRWATSDADIRGGPWRFKYVLPGLGASDVVRVNVHAPDF